MPELKGKREKNYRCPNCLFSCNLEGLFRVKDFVKLLDEHKKWLIEYFKNDNIWERLAMEEMLGNVEKIKQKVRDNS